MLLPWDASEISGPNPALPPLDFHTQFPDLCQYGSGSPAFRLCTSTPESQHCQCCVSACTAAINAQLAAVHQSLLCQVLGRSTAVIDISDTPVPSQPVAVGAAKSCSHVCRQTGAKTNKRGGTCLIGCAMSPGKCCHTSQHNGRTSQHTATHDDTLLHVHAACLGSCAVPG